MFLRPGAHVQPTTDGTDRGVRSDSCAADSSVGLDLLHIRPISGTFSGGRQCSLVGGVVDVLCVHDGRAYRIYLNSLPACSIVLLASERVSATPPNSVSVHLARQGMPAAWPQPGILSGRGASSCRRIALPSPGTSRHRPPPRRAIAQSGRQRARPGMLGASEPMFAGSRLCASNLQNDQTTTAQTGPCGSLG